MKKRFLCLLAALFVVCSCIVPAGAFSPKLTLAGFPDKALLEKFNNSAYGAIIDLTSSVPAKYTFCASDSSFDLQGKSFYWFDRHSFSFDWFIPDNSIVKSSGVSGVIYPTDSSITYVSSGVDVSKYTLPVKSLSDFSVGGGSEPSYDLESDWLSQTTGEGSYIIAPKSGKVFNGKDATTQIVAQYRFEHRKVLLGAGWHTGMQFTGYNKTLGVALTGNIFEGIFKLNDTATSIISHVEKVVTDAGGKEWIEGTITVQGKIPRNCSVEVQMLAYYTGPISSQHIVKESNKVSFSWFEDIVDDNNDGVDDRDENPSYNPDLSNPSDGLDDFKDFPSMLKGIAASVSGFLAFLKEFFAFIPAPIFAIMTVGIGLIVILRIAGR